MSNQKKKPRKFKPEFKLNVVLESYATGNIAATAERNGIHVTQLNYWRRQLLKDGAKTFIPRNRNKSRYRKKIEQLEKIIGRLTIQNELDWQVFERIKEVWETFPGWGYRKLAAALKRNEAAVNGKRVLRILKKYRGIQKRKLKPKPKSKFPNLIKMITKDLIKHPEKLARSNWILKDGKNRYRKIIKPTSALGWGLERN